jgi:hypothetical protein
MSESAEKIARAIYLASSRLRPCGRNRLPRVLSC